MAWTQTCSGKAATGFEREKNTGAHGERESSKHSQSKLGPGPGGP